MDIRDFQNGKFNLTPGEFYFLSLIQGLFFKTYEKRYIIGIQKKIIFMYENY